MSMKGKFFFFFLSILLSIIFINQKLYVLLALFLVLLIYCYKKFDIKYSLLMICFFVFFCFYRVNRIDESLNNQYVDSSYEIIEIKQTYIIIKDENKYIVYLDDTTIYEVGNIISIKGKIILLEKDLELDVFEFKEYLNNKRIHYQIQPYKINVIDKKVKLSHKIINVVTSKLSKESFKMTKMLLFNDKNIDQETYNNLKDISAIHLFVVSGFHISFLCSIIYKVFKNKEKVSLVISFVVTLFYVFLLDFAISALRAFLMTFLYKLFKTHINKLDSLSISGIIILLIEPLHVFNYSFIMSFLMAFVITLSSKTLFRYNKVMQAILLSLICFVVMIPIQLQLNYELNFISLISNILLSYVVMVIFVLCILGMFVSFVYPNAFGFIYKGFNQFVEQISTLDTSIVFGAMNKHMIIIYYLLVLLFLYFFEKKSFKKVIFSCFSLLVILLGLYNRQYFLPYQKVTFLNVYQGDCCLIQDSFTGKVMLIDTGGLINYDIASKKIVPYLKYHGIRKIDLIVITHDDYDQNGALESLCKQIEVQEIIDDCSIKQIELGKLKFTNLNTYYKEFVDKNDKSIVLYGNLCGFDFLFTGDISSRIEEKIVKDNPYLNVDVLKVAHHGSNTSTCEEFISVIKPEYSIISVGKNNYYGHPTETVLDILINNGSLIYRTDTNGSIRFIGKIFDFYFIESAK